MDIDIIVEPGTDIEHYIKEAAKIFPFEEVEEQSRIGKNLIEKRHFKFYYDSPVNKRRFYILLDVLFEENHYNTLVKRAFFVLEWAYTGEKTRKPCESLDFLDTFLPSNRG